MPSKKKLRLQASRRENSYQFLARFATAILASGTVISILFGYLAFRSTEAQLPGQSVLPFLPPFIGAAAAFVARPLKKLLQANLSDSIIAAAISIVVSLLAAWIVISLI